MAGAGQRRPVGGGGPADGLAASGVGVLLIEQFAHVALALANTAYILEGGRIRYHGTATELGDIAESHATHAVFGGSAPISCMKSYFGHTLGACGAQEAWLAIEMMNRDRFAPTLNLRNVDPRCASLDYIVDESRAIQTEFVMSNNFAFGGINTSLVFRRAA